GRVGPGGGVFEERLETPLVGGAADAARAPARLPRRDGVRGEPAGVGVSVEVGARLAGVGGGDHRREEQETDSRDAIPRHESLPASAMSVRASTTANSPWRSESAIACTSSAG